MVTRTSPVRYSLTAVVWTWSLTLVAVSIGFAQPEQARSVIDQHLRKAKGSGLIAVFVEGDQWKIEGYGQRSATDLTPPGEEDLFEIGALTQTFTALLALLCQEEGRFELFEPVQDYLALQTGDLQFQPFTCVEIVEPEADPTRPPKRLVTCAPDPAGDPVCVTFCDLASHASGLPLSLNSDFEWTPFVDLTKWEGPVQAISRHTFYRQLREVELKFAPGTGFHYSNVGMAILGHTLEDLFEYPLDSLFSRWIGKPLGMRDTRVAGSGVASPRMLQGLNHKGRPVPRALFDALAPAAGFQSSGRDLARFVQEIFSASPSSRLGIALEQSMQERLEVAFPTAPDETLVGYGWFSTPIAPGSPRRVHWQYGGTPGFRAFLGVCRDTHTGVVLLANAPQSLLELGFTLLEGMQP